MPGFDGSTKENRKTGRPTVGVLFAGPRFLIDRQFWAGAVEGASRHGLNAIAIGGGMLGDTRGFAATGNALFEIAGGRAFDAIVAWAGEMAVFTGSAPMDAFLSRFKGVPLVTAAYHLAGVPCVLGDNLGGMRKIMAHIMKDHGARRIAFIRGPGMHPEAEERFEAYRLALAEHGLPFDPQLVCKGFFDEASGREAVVELLDRRGLRFDAIIGANDPSAIGAMKELRSHGLRVPADVLVCGFDDRAEAPCSDPPLTTVRYSFSRLAESCMDKAAELLAGDEAAERTVLDMDLVIRGSCGCLSERIRTALDPSFAEEQRIGPADPSWRTSMTGAFRRFMQPEPGPGEQPKAHLPRDEFDKEALSGFLQAFGEPYGGEEEYGPRESNESRQDFISSLLRENYAEYAESSGHRLKDVAVAGRIDAADIATRHFERAIMNLENANDAMAMTMEQTSVMLGLSELKEALFRGLPGLGIDRFALSLYCGPDGAPRSRAFFAVGWTESGRLDCDGLEYDADFLAPAVFFPKDRHDFLIVPLYFQAEALGFALVSTPASNTQVCEILRSQLSRAIKASLLLAERERARSQLATAFNRLGLINKLGNLVAETADLDELLTSGVRLLREEFELYTVSVFLVDRKFRQRRSREQTAEPGLVPSFELRLRAISVLPGIVQPVLGQVIHSRARSLIAKAVTNNEVFVVPDVGREAEYMSTPELPDAKSETAIPLMVGRETVGVLDLQSLELNGFDVESLSALRSIAAYFANAIRNAELLADAAEAQAQAEEANRMKSSFLTGMSHELRTPLNSVINFAYLLGIGSEGELNAGQQDLCGRIETSGAHLLGLINDVLDLAKIESGKMELYMEEINPAALVDGIAAMLKGLVHDKPVQVLSSVAPGLPVLRGDRTRLRQILLNLASNAAKCTDSGSITISAATRENRFVFSVSDTGTGMDPADIGKAFSEFEQVGAPGARKPGTGLGLPISQRFAQMHGGFISVHTAIGKGSTFSLELPVDGRPIQQSQA